MTFYMAFNELRSAQVWDVLLILDSSKSLYISYFPNGAQRRMIGPCRHEEGLYLHLSLAGLMTDVPEIPQDQLQQRVVAMWMGSFYGSSTFVARKLGKKGLREFQDQGARQVAATFKKIGLEDPKDIALAIATNDKNLFGSEIAIEEGEGSAEIRRARCGLLAGAKAFSRVGASMIAKEHCKTCIESHWRKVFSDLGLKLEVDYQEDGCTMKISSQ